MIARNEDVNQFVSLAARKRRNCSPREVRLLAKTMEGVKQMKSVRLLVAMMFGAVGLVACGEGINSPAFAPQLAALSIDTPDNTSTPAGRSLALTSTGSFTTPPGSDQALEERPAKPDYSVTDTSIARIDGSTLVGLRVGTVEVTATQDGISSDSRTINVTPAVLDQIVVTPATMRIPQGASQLFTAMGVYSDSATPRAISPETVTWMSSDPTVATVPLVAGPTTTAQSVSNQAMPRVADATTTITARSSPNGEGNRISGTAVLTVGPPVFISVTTVTPNSISVPLGRVQEFMAAGARSDGFIGTVPDNQLTWTSSNLATAMIDAMGIASTLAQGTSTITAALTSDPVNQKATATLTVGPPALDRIVVCSDPNAPPVVCNEPAGTFAPTIGLPDGFQIVLTAFGIYSNNPTPQALTGTISCPPGSPPVFPTITWSSSRAPLDLFSPNPARTTTLTALNLAGPATVTARTTTMNETCAETPQPGSAVVTVTVP